MAEEPKQHQATNLRSLFLWFSLGHCANDFAPGAVWILAPAIAVALNLSPGELGLLITIHAVGASLAYLPAGVLADHVARRGRLLQVTFFWVAIGYALASLAPGFWSIAILMAIAGLGDAAWHPIATSVLVRLRPDRRAEALGVHALGGTLAEVLAPLAMGLLLASFDWRTALLAAAIPALLMGLAFQFVVRRIPAMPTNRPSYADFRALALLWLRPLGLRIVATISFYNMANIAILAMMPLYLQSVHNFSSQATGIAFAAMIFLGALAQPIVGRAADRTGRKPVIVVGSFLAAAAVFLVGLLDHNMVVALAGLLVAVMTLTAIRSALIAAAVDYAKEREGTTLGLAFSLLDGVGALGAWLAGLAGNVDLAFAFLLAAVLAVVSGLLALTLSFETVAPSPITASSTGDAR